MRGKWRDVGQRVQGFSYTGLFCLLADPDASHGSAWHNVPPSYGNYFVLVWGCVGGVPYRNRTPELSFFFSCCFLGLHLRHMEVPKLGVQLELQLPAHATATAMQDPSHIDDLHHSLQQCRILNPLSEARDQTLNLRVPSQIRFCCAMMGTLETTLF